MAITESKFKSIEELQAARIKLVKELKAQDFLTGMKNQLTKLYTASGHFIFELLQNAEDVYATSVTFKLEKNRLLFEHNGTRAFNLNDIDSITNYGNSTKLDNGNSIGKFGIGFKSVFEYTSSPEIHSVDYHFNIEDFFIPKIIKTYEKYDNTKTLIILPFNNVQKNEIKCYDEINASLNELKPTDLLFLRNITQIDCIIDTKTITIKRIDTYKENNSPDNICKISREEKEENAILFENNNTKEQSFYKRFFKTITILDDKGKDKEITISIAFLMNYVKDDSKWKIQPIFREGTNTPDGRIFAYFPCNAEERNFCFHIHAPFALKADREGLREEEANKIVIGELGSLLCESMKELKKDGLVDLDLYKALPNTKDDKYLWQYEIIQSKIIDFFINNPYILMKDGTYQDGKNKLIGFRNIQELLSDDDLAMISSSDQKKFWVKNPMKNQRDYNFLTSLGIREYNIIDFLKKLLEIKSSCNEQYVDIIKSFAKRDIKWFVKLYSLMDYSWNYSLDHQTQDEIKSLKLCYCNNNKIYPFNECYLSLSNDILNFDSNTFSFQYINQGCFKNSESDLYIFFENKLGIQSYGIRDFTSNICEKYQEKIDKKIEDILLFLELYKKDDYILSIISKYKILCSDNNEWEAPTSFYVPEEINDTTVKNISIYYDFYNTKTQNKLFKLNPEYRKLFNKEEELDNFYIFLAKLNCKTNFPVKEASCHNNPNWTKIYSEAPDKEYPSSRGANYDYSIPYFDEFLSRPSNEAVFELLSSALINMKKDYCQCLYSPGRKYPPKKYPSQIAHSLSNAKWFIQAENGKYFFVKPEEADESKTPSKYKPLIEDNTFKLWLKEINFGTQVFLKNKEYEKENNFLSSIGFDANSIGILRKFSKSDISEKVKEEILNNINSYLQSCLTEGIYQDDALDIDHLKEKSKEAFHAADDMEYENCTRHIRIKNPEKALAEPFLRQVCTNSHGDILCQICRNHLPFKKPDGKEYFEKVQLFPNFLIKKELRQNYIALCPVCSAKIKVFFHNDDKRRDLYDKIRFSSDNTTCFNITLDRDYQIVFSDRHIIELKQMIEESAK